MNRVGYLKRGFTIVELLIVIVVVGILAAITVVAYKGVSDRAKNAQVISSVNQSIKMLVMYKSEHDSWPAEAGPGSYNYCLGQGYQAQGKSNSSLSAPPSQAAPWPACTDAQESRVEESSWLTDSLRAYGELPGPVGVRRHTNGEVTFSPTYTTVLPNKSLAYTGVSFPGFKYPEKAPIDPWNRKGTRYYVRYAMAGVDHDCSGVQYAQPISSYQKNRVCLVLLEFYD